MKTPSARTLALALALLTASPSVACAEDCGTSVKIESRTEYYWSLSDTLASMQAELYETVLDPEPHVRTINETRRVTIPSSPEPQHIHINLQGSAECEAQAKGNGLHGLTEATAGATASLPNSITVGMPTGPGGSALPRGVRIYYAEDGSMLVDTTASPVWTVPVPAQAHVWPFYDLPLEPGYHEVTLPYTAGDNSGRGLFTPGTPDLTRLHSIAIANTLWPTDAQPSVLNTLTAVTNPIAMNLGVDGMSEFVVAPSPSINPQPSTLNSFYRLRAFPLAQPGDLDGDGFDDVTEYRCSICIRGGATGLPS